MGRQGRATYRRHPGGPVRALTRFGMRILYVSGSYIPSRRASSIQVMKMCAALARQGHGVDAIGKECAERQEPGVADDFDFYGVEPIFRLSKITRPARRGGGLSYLKGIRRFTTSRNRPPFDLYYCRDPLAAWQLARASRPVLYEAHGPPASWLSSTAHRRLMRLPSLRRLVVISRALRDRFESLALVPHHGDVVVAHDAAEPLQTAAPAPIEGRRPRLGYAGHLYPGKGAEILLELARRLPRCEIHVVGGAERDLARWRREPRPDNLLFHGFVPPGRLAGVISELDILLMPYQGHVVGASGSSDISRWMSPLKLFEYMAAGRPIVASNLPVLGEILEHEHNSLMVPPADPDAWAGAIQRLLANEALRGRLAETARREQRECHTWDARARAVLEGLPSGRG